MGVDREERTGLDASEAKQFYDSLGSKQDIQFYENRALMALIDFSDFEHAESVFEFGCGTGRFAVELLTRKLSEQCRYHGIDISETMVGICGERLMKWKERAGVGLVSGSISIDAADNTFDRFVSMYVLDLLSSDDIGKVLSEAHRILKENGLLCIVSLTRGDTPFCRSISSAWLKVFSVKPYRVGGCRPVNIGRNLTRSKWTVIHDENISAFGISSEVLVAKPVKVGSLAQ